MQATTRNINLKVGLLRVYIAVQVCWIIGSGILYLLNWPGDWKHDPDSQPWIIRAENVNACQDRVRSYQSEHDLNNLARRIHNALPEAPNFGRDERGLQITTLRDALRECDQRYPEPSNKNGSLLRGAFRTIRDDSPAGSLPTVYRLILAVILFLLPTFAYLFLYASGFATVRTVRWISHGFKKGMAP